MTIEVTTEMLAAYEAADLPDLGRLIQPSPAGIAAVLAIVERDYNLVPAMCDAPHPTEDLAYCELPRGHAERSGRGHSATVTKALDW